MKDFSFGAGLMDGEDVFHDQENEAGGLQGEKDDPKDDFGKSQLDYYNELLKRLDESASQSYGQNAAQRWSGTPAVGFSAFQKRDPIYGATGKTYRDGTPEQVQRIDASTHFATPPEGLTGGIAMQRQLAGQGNSSLTPEAEWRKKFPAAGGAQTDTDWAKTFGGGKYSWDAAYPHAAPHPTAYAY